MNRYQKLNIRWKLISVKRTTKKIEAYIVECVTKPLSTKFFQQIGQNSKEQQMQAKLSTDRLKFEKKVKVLHSTTFSVVDDGRKKVVGNKQDKTVDKKRQEQKLVNNLTFYLPSVDSLQWNLWAIKNDSKKQ